MKRGKLDATQNISCTRSFSFSSTFNVISRNFLLLFVQYSSILGWSDFHFFFDVRKWAHCCRLSIFLRNRRSLPRTAHARQNFHFQKITETLKINFFFFNFQKPSFYIKKTIVKNRIKIRIC